MAKGFSRLRRRAEASHAIHGIKIAKNAPPLTHLMFAADTLLLGKTTLEEVNTIQCLLLDFESMFGLQVIILSPPSYCHVILIVKGKLQS